MKHPIVEEFERLGEAAVRERLPTYDARRHAMAGAWLARRAAQSPSPLSDTSRSRALAEAQLRLLAALVHEAKSARVWARSAAILSALAVALATLALLFS